jgi:DNA-binding NarL/FixJ family response regulator
MAQTSRPITVLIYNKHTMFRDGIKALFADGSTIRIVGEAATAKRAIHLLERVHPDIVLMDTVRTDLSSPEATEKIKAIDPHVQVLIVSLDEDEPLISRCLRAGAAGYVPKENRTPQLRDAINTAFHGASRNSSFAVSGKAR